MKKRHKDKAKTEPEKDKQREKGQSETKRDIGIKRQKKTEALK